MEYRLCPSILSADFNRLGEQIKILEKEGVEYLHIDVMDGDFVPSISFGMPVIKSIRKESNMFFDVHLMVTEPERYIRDFVECGAVTVAVPSPLSLTSYSDSGTITFPFNTVAFNSAPFFTTETVVFARSFLTTFQVTLISFVLVDSLAITPVHTFLSKL